MYAALHGTTLALVAAVQWQQVHTVNITSYFDIFLVSIDKLGSYYGQEDHTRA